jgi:hypothetical protein
MNGWMDELLPRPGCCALSLLHPTDVPAELQSQFDLSRRVLTITSRYPAMNNSVWVHIRVSALHIVSGMKVRGSMRWRNTPEASTWLASLDMGEPYLFDIPQVRIGYPPKYVLTHPSSLHVHTDTPIVTHPHG